jgi:hypothetical protein
MKPKAGFEPVILLSPWSVCYLNRHDHFLSTCCMPGSVLCVLCLVVWFLLEESWPFTHWGGETCSQSCVGAKQSKGRPKTHTSRSPLSLRNSSLWSCVPLSLHLSVKRGPESPAQGWRWSEAVLHQHPSLLILPPSLSVWRRHGCTWLPTQSFTHTSPLLPFHSYTLT